MISIIIPTYNREKTITEAIKSILNQTYQDFELLIIDDGSTDRTRELVEAIKDSRVKYLYQENQGACVARNYGIDCSRGSYIAFQDSDDLWLPEKLEKQLKVFQNNKNIDIVCCKASCVRLDGTTIYPMKDFQEGIIDNLHGPIGISTQTIMIKKEVAQKVKFDPKVTRYQDLDFLLSAQKIFNIYCMNEYLVERFHNVDSITNHPERTYNMELYFEKKYSEIFKRKNNYLSKFFSSALLDAGNQINNKKDQYKFCKKALELNPSFVMKLKYLMIKTHLYSIYTLVLRLIEKE